MKKGFTLIEVLIVIAIVTMLAAIVIIAINPARQFAQARNTARWSAVNAILNAVHQNMIDNNGDFDFSGCPATLIPSAATNIAPDDGDPLTNEVDLCGCLVPTYVAALPYDPSIGSYTSCTTTYNTGYTILQDANGRITVAAPRALTETVPATITVTR